MKGRVVFIFLLLCLTAPAVLAQRIRDDQFKSDPFSQNYADTTDKTAADSSQLFSFKQFVGGLTHKHSASLKNMFMGSTVLIGGQQIYNRQYWKLPLVYGSIGAGVGFGIYYNNQFKQTEDEKFKKYSTYAFAAAGLAYWATLMDGITNYPSDRHPDPAKATLYSVLLPGLGQVYNGEFWKIPIYWGAIAGGIHFYAVNKKNYARFKWIYDQATSEDPLIVERPPIPAETALYYRDVYRRWRDYSVLATALFYLLQVMDANVFAYMQDFEVNDDITMQLQPTVISPDFNLALQPPAIGLQFGLRF